MGPTDQTRERIPPKTPRSRRMVPLPAMVAVALSEHIREFAPAPDGLLFHTRTEAPYLYSSYQRVFGKAVAHAKLPATGTHDLRHHYASVLLAADESVVALAEQLGHDDATLVLTNYGHLMPGSEDRTRKPSTRPGTRFQIPSAILARPSDGPDDHCRPPVQVRGLSAGGGGGRRATNYSRGAQLQDQVAAFHLRHGFDRQPGHRAGLGCS
ncbi:MAG: tyrosine-type recombinase/integrase, partial [Pseudonocardiaceae bacterium]